MLKMYVKAGDTRPIPEVSVVDGDGAPIDLSGATATFSMWQLEATTPTIDAAAATIPAPGTGGVLQYVWAEGDTDEPGQYVAEFTVTFADSVQLTVPSRGFVEIEIQEKLVAPTP